MDEEINNKFDDINSYISHLESQIKKGTTANLVIYGIIVVIFLVYAVTIPGMINSITSPEEGPGTLVQVLDDNMPSNKELIETAKQEAPQWVANGLDQIWDLVPTLEGILLDGMSDMTKQFVASIEKNSAPHLKEFMFSEIKKIKENSPDITDAKMRQAFNASIRQFVKQQLTVMSTDAQVKFLQALRSFKKYKQPNAKLSSKEQTEKNILLAFLRLRSDQKYKDQLGDIFFKALEKAYLQISLN